MFDSIVAIANERVVTSDDFKQFVGERNFMSVDFTDIPMQDRTIALRYIGGAVIEFEIHRVFDNTVRILGFFTSHPQGIAMDYDADELAIRIEDA